MPVVCASPGDLCRLCNRPVYAGQKVTLRGSGRAVRAEELPNGELIFEEEPEWIVEHEDCSDPEGADEHA